MFPSIPNPNFKLHVGWRTIKTAVSAMLVAIVYCLIGRNPAFACIGVIFGMGVDMQDSIKNGGNRLFGTLIGGLLSIVVFWIYLLFYPQGGHSVFLAVLLGFATVVLILLCQYFWPGGVQPGGVVLCIVLFSTPIESYVSYALNRILDTAIGVIVALLVNYFLPRARVVAFLWRAAGSPKVENGKNPFTDVKADAYYYDAVLWAVEQGVTSGTSATTFSPDATVTRGQTVTFLYRNAGSPEVSGTMPFTDVEADAYYAKAVQWAVQQKITTGTSETTFSPMSDCTRGQIVTFLYRAK